MLTLSDCLSCMHLIVTNKQDGGLCIPLHAYPRSGSPLLPKQLDLGAVPLGESRSHTLQLTCTTGMPFDFSVTVLQHNQHFLVTPLAGTVPACGGAAVTVNFTPSRYSTEHLQLQVLLSEYGAEPMQVLVSGSCKPGLVQQKVIRQALEQQLETLAELSTSGA